MTDRASELKRKLDLAVRAEDGNIPCASFPDAYFPDLGVNERSSLTQQAIEGCRNCPLMNLCGEYAIEAAEEYGIWGGLTPLKRLQIVRARRRTKRYADALKLA